METIASARTLFFLAFKLPICVEEVNPVEVEPIVLAAQANMRRNIAVVREIADVTLQDLDAYWSSVKHFQFDGEGIGYTLNGLSSMDSARVYISCNPLSRSDQLSCQQDLEFEYANSLSHWRKTNPYLVSACIDRSLRAVDCEDAVVGAGNFYHERVHEKGAEIPYPFDLNCWIVDRL
jgi:hypothetical protein